MEEPEPEPEPAPPPKCELLTEKCKAKGDEKLRVPGTKYEFTPPKGWIYAHNDEVAATHVNTKGAALVFASVKVAKGWGKKKKQRDAKVAELVKFLDIDEVPKAVTFRSAEDVGKLKISLGEVVDMARNGSPGFVLLVSAIVDDRMIVGVAFAPDKESSAKINDSWRGLALAEDDEKDEDAADKDDGDEDKSK